MAARRVRAILAALAVVYVDVASARKPTRYWRIGYKLIGAQLNNQVR